MTRLLLNLFGLVFVLPIGLSAARHVSRDVGTDWWAADRSSAGLLPPAASAPQAMVRVFAAPTVRWRGIVAVHSWVVLKPAGGDAYTRYDVTAWGDPLRVNGFVPDGRWFGRDPEVIFAADGPEADALIPRMQAAIDAYAWQRRGDYRAWPGPNSNTFVAAVLEAVPERGIALPPTAIGRDFPHDGRWLRATAQGLGFRLTLGGYAGVTLGTVEGIELNILGAVAGIDVLRPALKLPGLGRIGLPVAEARVADGAD
ncbi:DUF3750 domain-containing protein [Roseomonas sp. CAU 1739]|uniref:DUF3750 domain-containing protein n=1 Tax=Roseomonas sp. CAU 1739 TaxID=3140364 RepID=UPI00325B6444